MPSRLSSSRGGSEAALWFPSAKRLSSIATSGPSATPDSCLHLETGWSERFLTAAECQYGATGYVCGCVFDLATLQIAAQISRVLYTAACCGDFN